MTTEWMCGDALECLRALPDESVNCVVTSPPYWGLRDYGTATWEGGDPACDHKPPDEAGQTNKPSAGQREHAGRFAGKECWKCGALRIDSQIGLERTPEEYVARLMEVFREVRRVLRGDGTCWVVIGDSYNAHPGQRKVTDKAGPMQVSNTASLGAPSRHVDSLKPKDLVGIPWRVAFALQADGWWLRQDIVWAKPNPMPESVRDRCTKSHEYIFLLTKSAKYWYDADAISEASAYPGDNRALRTDTRKLVDVMCLDGGSRARTGNPTGPTRNKRSVWTITPKPFSDWAYDFKKADYVDGRGIPRKLSPNCPVHVPSLTPRGVFGGQEQCDGQQDYSDSRIDDTDDHPFQSNPSAPVPTADCNDELDQQPGEIQRHSPLSKISVSHTYLPETSYHIDDNQQTPIHPSKKDLLLLEDSRFATSRSRQTSKTDPALVSYGYGRGAGKTASHTEYTESVLTAQDNSTPSNNTEELSPDCASLVQSCDSEHKQSYKSCSASLRNEYKCSCPICQVSHFATFPPELPEICIKAGCPPAGIVLDPFAGAGTTGLVAQRLGRSFVGIELNTDYVAMAKRRLERDAI